MPTLSTIKEVRSAAGEKSDEEYQYLYLYSMILLEVWFLNRIHFCGYIFDYKKNVARKNVARKNVAEAYQTRKNVARNNVNGKNVA